jgi:membrane protease YdiL (CAAX protease family)
VNSVELAKIPFFFLLIGAIVLFSPLGPVPSYLIIIVLSLGFMLSSGIEARPGKPIPGLLAGTLAIVAVFIIIFAAGGLTVKGFKTDAAMALLWGAVLQVFVAVGEELSFRHYIFANLDRLSSGRKAAAAISSAGFAAMHMPSLVLLHATPTEFGIALATIFIASLMLTVLYLKAGILAAIGFHFAWNFLQYNVFGFSYMDAALEITKTGSDLLTGGIFGPEASIPGLIVMTATLGAVWYYYRWKEEKSQKTD